MARFCPECGTQIIVETSKFCNNCGANISKMIGEKREELVTEQTATEGQPLTVEFILGLFGGIIGLFAGGAVLFIASLGSAFPETHILVAIITIFLIFPTIGIIGAAIVKIKTKISGYLMIISAIGGLICLGTLYVPSFILLIIAGVMAVRYKH